MQNRTVAAMHVFDFMAFFVANCMQLGAKHQCHLCKPSVAFPGGEARVSQAMETVGSGKVRANCSPLKQFVNHKAELPHVDGCTIQLSLRAQSLCPSASRWARQPTTSEPGAVLYTHELSSRTGSQDCVQHVRRLHDTWLSCQPRVSEVRVAIDEHIRN